MEGLLLREVRRRVIGRGTSTVPAVGAVNPRLSAGALWLVGPVRTNHASGTVRSAKLSSTTEVCRIVTPLKAVEKVKQGVYY
ncbi:hypothetical protein EXN66_Car012610 [Channa argus]|uniref:Uncharacterized protein n=1 Tax=Channa argus TaxID=215402 RepID=A0A6G1Q2T4_CHAAH|nr:hypothetical protein EXN66_Car012610 [Channa argus]